MELRANKIYKPLFTEKPRYIICMGGRASGRSYAASQYALLHLTTDKYFRGAIMRFVLGDIRNSIFQEIRDRIEEQELDNEIKITDHLLSFEYGDNKINGIGFRKSSGDQKSKLKSLANYNCVIIEEADEVNEEDFQQLDDSLRTKKGDITVILLLNPPDKNHWIVKRWFNLIPSGIEGFYKTELKESEKDTVFIHGTYHDNEVNLNQKTVENFERYKQRNSDHYYNMIQGLVSEGARGRVFKDWKIFNDFESLPYKSFYGLDFGFSNDPAALVEIKQHNDKIWLRELIYETGLTNQALSRRLKELGLTSSDQIFADSAEPKSIEELRLENWNVEPAPKGADSIRAGIDILLSKEIHYTEPSTNIALETQNYKWALDKNKEPTNKPIDEWNHLMDATRYGVYANSKKAFVGFV
jgi:phage terminase large subunit